MSFTSGSTFSTTTPSTGFSFGGGDAAKSLFGGANTDNKPGFNFSLSTTTPAFGGSSFAFGSTTTTVAPTTSLFTTNTTTAPKQVVQLPLNFSGFNSPPNQTVGSPGFGQPVAQNAAQNTSFGSPTLQQPPAFSTPAAAQASSGLAFGSQNSSFSFGKPTTSTSGFSFNTPTSGFSTAPQASGATTSTAQTNQSNFSLSSTFASPQTTSAFGQSAFSANPTFNFAPMPANRISGVSATTAAANTAPTFGTTISSNFSFGQATSTFATPQQNSSLNMSSTPNFGTSQPTTTPAFGSTTTGITFVTPPNEAQTRLSFGTTTTPSGVGFIPQTGLASQPQTSSGLTFGTAGQTPTGLGFGTSQAQGLGFGTPATQGGLNFGTTTVPTTQATGGLSFGTTLSSTAQTSTGLNFGTSASSAPKTGLNFGTTPASAAGAGLNFGTTPAPAASTGLGFGTTPASSATTGLGFGATPASTTTGGLNFGATPISSSGTGLSFGTPASTATTTSSGVGFSAGTVLAKPTTTTMAAGFQLGKTLATSTGFSLTSAASSQPSSTVATTTSAPLMLTTTTTTMPKLTAVTNTTALAVPQPILSITFGQLEENMNKWTLELEEQEKMFINQATQINAWDRLLIANGEKIVELNDAVESVKNEQQSLEHELDFVLAQQKELEELLTPMEKQLLEDTVDRLRDPEREHMYSLAENLDTQLRQMSEDLKEVIEHLNETNRSQDSNDPIVQIGRILNAHMSSMQWIDNSIAQISNKLDHLKATHDMLRRDNERSFQLTYN